MRLIVFRNSVLTRVSRFFGLYDPPTMSHKPYQNVLMRCVSTSSVSEDLSWGGCSRAVLLGKVESALTEHRVNDAWDTYKDFKRLYGFPDDVLLSRLVTDMSYSSDSKWVKRAASLVLSISEEKSDLLRPDALTKLSLALARAQMPVLASIVLRLMLKRKFLPPVDMLRLVFLHLVKTNTGSVLATNILVEICDCFRELDANKSHCMKSRKPDTMIFNLVLDGCVRFQSFFKGQQIIELMAQVGVEADAHTIIITAQIHGMNGMRDELKKFKTHVDMVSVAFPSHYRQFYDSLLNLHYKFNDVDAASALILDIYNQEDARPRQAARRGLQKPDTVSIGSHNLRAGLKLKILPHILQKDSVFKVEEKPELIIYKNGKLVLTNKALAKLIIGYKRNGGISELSRFLVEMHKKSDESEFNNVCMDVVAACIHLNWLETAHDILDDSKLQGKSLGSNLYKALLTAYHDKKMFREAETLLKQVKETGLVATENFAMYPAECCLKFRDKDNLKELPSERRSNLAECVLRELKEDGKILDAANELNSSIYYFMKAKMTADALKTYRRMQEMKIQPIVATFFYLVSGCSSLGMYREISILWGDIKKNVEHGNLIIDRDLYELILCNFIRGGYFERVIEVMSLMKVNGMYLDKWMYKWEYMKFHKDLYRRLRACDAKNESQSQRVEHVRAFRDWVGLS